MRLTSIREIGGCEYRGHFSDPARLQQHDGQNGPLGFEIAGRGTVKLKTAGRARDRSGDPYKMFLLFRRKIVRIPSVRCQAFGQP